MLLIIHNLPTKIRYCEVKALIKDRCGITDIILDNLVYEKQQGRKVTVGVHNEDDAAQVFKELNGFNFMGNKLHVEIMRPTKQPNANQGYSTQNKIQRQEYENKMDQNNMQGMQYMSTSNMFSSAMYNMPSNQQPSANQGYSTQNKIQRQEYGNEMNQNNMQGMQSMGTSTMTSSAMYNMSFNQGPGYQYGEMIGQSPNDALMQAQYIAFCNSISGGGSNMLRNQNTDMTYSGPPNYGNNQQPMVNSNDFGTFPGAISMNDPHSTDQGGSYPPDDRQSFGRSTRDSSDRNHRMPPAWNQRDPESRSRSNFPDDKRYDDRNRSDDNSGRSGAGNNRQGESHSDRNARQAGQYNSWSRETSCNRGPGGEGNSRHSDGGSYHRGSDGKNSRRYGDDGHYDVNSSRTSSTNHDRSRDRGHGYADNNSRPYSAGPKQKGFEYGNSKAGPWQKQEPHNRNKDSREMRAGNNIQTTAVTKKPNPSVLPKSTNKSSIEAMKNKDETWRGQATAAIAKDLLLKFNKPYLLNKPSFLNFLKSFIRSRINNLVGKRECVPLNQMIDEYHQRHTPDKQREFLCDIINKFEMSPPPQEPNRNNSTVPGAKRPGHTNTGSNPAKKPKSQEALVTGEQQQLAPGDRLPSYPNANKKEYNKNKQLVKKAYTDPNILKLSPEEQKALDEEVQVLCNLYTEECKTGEDNTEESIVQRIMGTVEEFRKVITVDLAKRILNITVNLPLRIFSAEQLKKRVIEQKLKELGVISLRKSKNRKVFVANCQNFESYDRLCAMEKVDINGHIVKIKPLHLGMLPKSYRNKKKNMQNEGEEDAGNEEDVSDGEGEDDDDNASDEENVDYEDEGDQEPGDEEYDIDDSNTYGVGDASDGHKSVTNTVDVIEEKSGNDVEIIEVKNKGISITIDDFDTTQAKDKTDLIDTPVASNGCAIASVVRNSEATSMCDADVGIITQDELEDY